MMRGHRWQAKRMASGYSRRYTPYGTGVVGSRYNTGCYGSGVTAVRPLLAYATSVMLQRYRIMMTTVYRRHSDTSCETITYGQEQDKRDAQLLNT